MDAKVLVLAFDGMDHELINKFGLTAITQEEFGKIDNKSNMSSIKTSELFASFITGANYESHGVRGLETTVDKKKLLDSVFPKLLMDNLKGAYRLKEVLSAALGNYKGKRYSKEDLKGVTIFEKIENSRAMFVPAYNPSVFWAVGAEAMPLGKGYSKEETVNYYDSREFSYRKEELMSELGNEILGSRDLLMCHIHRLDMYQHLFGDEEVHYDETKLKRLYLELDDLANEIQEAALKSGYDYVIFMSDHGLPTEEGHNENAFYSCNKELFGDETPHITDFHDKILALTGNEEKIEAD